MDIVARVCHVFAILLSVFAAVLVQAPAAYAQISQVGSAIATGTNENDNDVVDLVITVPGAGANAVIQGNLIVLAVAIRDPGNTAVSLGLPTTSGSAVTVWNNPIQFHPEDPNNGNDKATLAIFWKVADANDATAHTITIPNAIAGKQAAAIMLQYANVDTTNPFNAVGVARSQEGPPEVDKDNAFPAPSVTAVSPITLADAEALRFFLYRDPNVNNASANEDIVDGDTLNVAAIAELAEIQGRKANDQSKISLVVSRDTALTNPTGIATAEDADNNDKEWGTATVILQPAVPAPNVSIDKIYINAQDRSAGQNAQYQIDVTNNGTLQAENVVITDILPPNFTLTGVPVTTYTGGASGATTIGSTVAAPTFGTYTLPAGGGAVRIQFDAAIPANQAVGTYSNFASVSGGNFSTVTDDGTDTDEDINVTAPSLSLDKQTSTTAMLSNGETAMFTITVASDGTEMASNVSVIDTLPSGLSFGSVISTVKSDLTVIGPDPAANTGIAPIVEFAGYTIPVGESLTITYTATVDADSVSGSYSNSAQATATGTNSPVDTASVTVCAGSH